MRMRSVCISVRVCVRACVRVCVCSNGQVHAYAQAPPSWLVHEYVHGQCLLNVYDEPKRVGTSFAVALRFVTFSIRSTFLVIFLFVKPQTRSHTSQPWDGIVGWLESTQGRSVGLSGPCANATAPPRHMPLWRVTASRAGQPNPTRRLRRATASIEGRVLSFAVTLGPPHSAGGAEIRLRHAMSHMHVQIPCVRRNSTHLNSY